MTLSLGLVSETEAQQTVIDLALRQWRTLVPQSLKRDCAMWRNVLQEGGSPARPGDPVFTGGRF
jgi:hypothetical protein